MIAATFSDPLFLLGLVLMFAVLLGAATERVGVPWITGCIVAGVLLGPSLLGLLKSTALHDFGVFLQASLALIAFSIGSRLTLPKLSAIGASIAWLTVLQLLAPMILVLVALAAIGVSWPTAIIAAAVAPATAPTTTYAIVQRRKASGLFVDRALGILAINDAATILIFSVVSAAIVAWLGAETANGGAFFALGRAALQEGLSLATGAVFGVVYILLYAVVADGRPGSEDRMRAMLYALLLLAVGAAVALKLSHLMTPLAMGVTIANGGKAAEQLGKRALGDIEQPLYMVFFVLAGAHLPVGDLAKGAMLAAAAAYVLARVGGKYFGVFFGALLLRLDSETRRYLGLCFPSQGGAAMGLVLACAGSSAARALAPDAQGQIDLAVSIVLLGVLLSQLFGPIVIDYAIRRGAGAETPPEALPERARHRETRNERV